MPRFNINFYEKENGSSPVKDFLDDLPIKMRAKILKELLLLEEFGNELREPYSKKVSENIFELRAIQGNNITRLLYFFYIDHEIIVTNGLKKKSRKTPKNAIETAEIYRLDYLKRRKKNE